LPTRCTSPNEIEMAIRPSGIATGVTSGSSATKFVDSRICPGLTLSIDSRPAFSGVTAVRAPVGAMSAGTCVVSARPPETASPRVIPRGIVDVVTSTVTGCCSSITRCSAPRM
jgi:hypothetical protein